MGLEAALERPERVLGTLVIVEDEAEVVGRALLSDRLLECIRDQLLGHAPGHRPAHDLPCGTRGSRMRGRAILCVVK